MTQFVKPLRPLNCLDTDKQLIDGKREKKMRDVFVCLLLLIMNFEIGIYGFRDISYLCIVEEMLLNEISIDGVKPFLIRIDNQAILKHRCWTALISLFSKIYDMFFLDLTSFFLLHFVF